MSSLVTREGLQVYVPDGRVLSQFFWSEARVQIVQGPVGSGTSSACFQKLHRLSHEQEPDFDGVRRTRWVILADTYPNHEKKTIKTYLEWFPQTKFGQLRMATPPTVTHRLDHPDGETTIESEWIFMAAETIEQAMALTPSLEITGLFANEIQLQEKDVLMAFLKRTNRYPSKKNGPGATWYGMIADMNAPVEGHFVPYMRQAPGDPPLPRDWDDETKNKFIAPAGWEFFLQPPGLIEEMHNGEITYRENPEAENQKWLADGYYLEKADDFTKAEIDSDIMNRVTLRRSGKPVYPLFSRSDHVLRVAKAAEPGFPIVVGLDFGREPAAAFCQKVRGTWYVLSELIGSGESAAIFAPRVKEHLAEYYPGYQALLWGDPRGADGTQATEQTAFGVFRDFGMNVLAAPGENSPELRRSTMDTVLQRRNGLKSNPDNIMINNGMSGGYHYPKIKGTGIFREKPLKNAYSHVCEALENAILGGGEGSSPVAGSNKPAPVVHKRERFRFRR